MKPLQIAALTAGAGALVFVGMRRRVFSRRGLVLLGLRFAVAGAGLLIEKRDRHKLQKLRSSSHGIA